MSIHRYLLGENTLFLTVGKQWMLNGGVPGDKKYVHIKKKKLSFCRLFYYTVTSCFNISHKSCRSDGIAIILVVLAFVDDPSIAQKMIWNASFLLAKIHGDWSVETNTSYWRYGSVKWIALIIVECHNMYYYK